MNEIESIRSELNSRIEELKKETNRRLDALVKPELIKGRWYVATRPDDSNSWLFLFDRIDNHVYYNIMMYGSEYLESYCLSKTHIYRRATDEEVKTALVASATRRGFKEGVKIKRGEAFRKVRNKFNPLIPDPVILRDDAPEYNSENDSLKIGGYYIYCKGEWAEIIEDEKIKIIGRVVEHDRRLATYEDEKHKTIANCKITYDHEGVKIRHQITTLLFTKSEIEQILKGFK